MKRFFTVFGLFGAAVLVMGTPGPDHKISWCHFPPGRDGEKVNILKIDVAADGTIGPAHQNHVGDGPVCYSNDPNAADLTAQGFLCAPNPPTILQSLGPGCGGCGTVTAFDPNTGTPTPVQLVPGAGGQCVCPPNTQ